MVLFILLYQIQQTLNGFNMTVLYSKIQRVDEQINNFETNIKLL